MAEKIVMPQLGESIAEGTVVEWLKSVGDTVQKDENVLLISTDKVEAEIPSPITGVLIEAKVGPGETVAIGTVLGWVGAAGEEMVSTPKAPALQALAPSLPSQARVPAESSRFLSPLVKKIAQENQVAPNTLEALSGSGRDGRLTKNDLLAHLAKTVMPAQVSAAQTTLIPEGQHEAFKPISTMRRVIMENMSASRRISAHVTTFFEIDYTAIDRVRATHQDRFKAEEGVSLTYTTFLAAALCIALKRHPYLNAEMKDDRILFKKDVHLGIAVGIEQPEPGLMVPVIRHADQMNLRGLARSIADLATRVRSKKIRPDELSGGSFSLTNPGNYGAIIGTPIINQPQVAILGVGKIKKQPVVLEIDTGDVIAIRNRGWLSLSFDHRLIDGATADIFMADLKQIMETWTTQP
ncbi:MAG: 2-oxo acid dehydrogenase subunit E2 [Myxococcaceae bacterium]|nr:2-oxo acid dehydrogenase subunit E2 [Myxococcaceae bacterium]